MKKFGFGYWFILLIVFLFVPFCAVGISSSAQAEESYHINIDFSAGDLREIEGDYSSYIINSNEDLYDFLNSIKSSFGYSSSREALKISKVIDSTSGKIYRLDQVIEGTRVFGSQVVVSADKNGRVLTVSGKYFKNINLDKTINHSKEEGLDLLKEANSASEVSFKEQVYRVDSNSTYLCYVYEINNLMSSSEVYLSARNLMQVDKFDSDEGLVSNLPTSGYTISTESTIQHDYYGREVELDVLKYTSRKDGSYFFVLADQDRHIYVTNGEHKEDYTYRYYDSYDPSAYFDDPVAVEAFKSLLKCYDFYASPENFGQTMYGIQNSLGQTIDLIAIVHFGEDYCNAGCYVPSSSSSIGYFIFGDGDVDLGLRSFVCGVDVVGHEYQHSISDSIVSLKYMNAPGAISEAFSDIFGACIEGYDLTDDNFWRMGEGLCLPETNPFTGEIINDSVCLRNMKAPWTVKNHAYSYNKLFPFCYNSSHAHTNCDNGGVHYNSTLLTYATYVMYNYNPEFFTKYHILELWYRTLCHLNEVASFEEFADAFVLSAEELYKTRNDYSQILQTINYAFAIVDMPGFEGEIVWGGENLSPLEGSGTVASPYLIDSLSSLASFAYYINEGENELMRTARYKLTADIDLGGKQWVPIGTEEKPFNGYFNGGSHTISGLNLAGVEDDYAGLFGVVGERGYIYYLNVGGQTDSTQALYSGAIAGKLLGSLSNCSAKVNISGKNVGGLIGLAINNAGGGKIDGCYFSGSLEGENVGGIASILASSASNDYNIHNPAYISGSYVEGYLKASEIAGGFFAQANAIAIVSSISAVNIDKNTNIAGGLVGELYFDNVLGSDEVSADKNMFINCYVCVEKSGAIFGEIFAKSQGNGQTVVKDCTLKKIEEGANCYQYGDKEDTIKIDNVLSNSSLFEDDFNLDDKLFIENENNFTSISGLSIFDTINWKISSGKLPTFAEPEFWINSGNYASSFAGGNGTESSPILIDNAKQLARLAIILTSNQASTYSTLHYKLTSDIDLSGKIWTGIGTMAVQYIEQNGVREIIARQTMPFRGTFDGDGHTIYNLTSLEASSINSVNDSGTNYIIYSFFAGLFGITSDAVIKNVTIEKASIVGSAVGGAVARSLDSLTLQNVSVIGGYISASNYAGGLVGIVGDTNKNLGLTKTEITNCFVHSTISAQIAGGAVGVCERARQNESAELEISNFVLRGKIIVSGIDLASQDEYIRPIAGGVVGLALQDRVSLANCIIFANIECLQASGILSGFVGAVGMSSSLSANQIEINLLGCSLLSEMNFYFESGKIGTALGGVYQNFLGNVSINIDICQTNKTYPLKGEGKAEILGEFEKVEDEFGEGKFDFYSENTFLDPNLFDSSALEKIEDLSKFIEKTMYNVVYIKMWTYSEELGKEILVNAINPIKLKQGEKINISEVVPERASAEDDRNNYVFVGWSRQTENIDRTTTIFAEFDPVLKEFEIKYLDENDNVLQIVKQTYGSRLDQDVVAPEKKGNFFITYTFEGWGRSAQQIVTKNMSVYPYYKAHLTFYGLLTILAIIISVLITLYVVFVVLRKRKQ